MSDLKEFQQLIDSFVAYRNLLQPIQESLHSVAETYEAIRTDLDSLNKSLSGNASAKLEAIHTTLNEQAKNSQVLAGKIESFAESGEKYAKAVDIITNEFSEVVLKLQKVAEIEKTAENALSRLDEIVAEKTVNYNLKDLQKSLDAYNKNVEKISEFINRDIATVLQQNADKIEAIRKENEQLASVVSEQGKTVAQLTAAFVETSTLLRKTVENGSVNQEYLFDAFDKWAQDRKVKTKKK